jgi:hypothetical protein
MDKKMTEQKLHNAVIEYLDLQYPQTLYTSTMGGLYLGKGNFRQKNIIKKHYRKGVPDILIFETRNKFHGLMLELKTLKGRPSKEQLQWRNDLNERNYISEICYGFEDAKEIIDRYLLGKIK